MKFPKRYAPEFKERAIRLILEHRKDYCSQWAALRSIAEKVCCIPESLRVWVRDSERDQGLREGPSSSEKARIKGLERENKELLPANEILRKAAAFFTQAERDRWGKS